MSGSRSRRKPSGHGFLRRFHHVHTMVNALRETNAVGAAIAQAIAFLKVALA